MEHLEKRTLSERIAEGPLSVDEVLRYAIDLASALQQIHRQDGVYGSLDPARIVFTPSGAEFLGSQDTTAENSPYRAPEQVLGESEDSRTDVFALGAVIYEMATGRKAFEADTPEGLRTAILEIDPPPVPAPELDRLIRACLAKEPDQRRQRVQNVLLDLKLIVASRRRRKAHAASAARKKEAAPPNTSTGLALPIPVPPQAAPSEASSEPVRSAIQPVMPEPAAVPVSSLPGLPQVAPVPAETPPPAAAREEAQLRTAEIEGETGPTVHRVELLPPETTRRELADIASRSQAEAEQSDESKPASISNEGKREDSPTPEIRQIRIEPVGKSWSRFARVAAVVGVAALVGLAAYAYFRRNVSTAAVLKFSVATPENAMYPSSPAISPDGQILVFSAVNSKGKRRLWIRPLNSLTAQELPDTDEGVAPFWSPDSQYIAFFTSNKLRKVKVSGGASQDLCGTSGFAGGGTWSKNGSILFARGLSDGLYRVPDTGGAEQRVTSLDGSKRERAHLWPQFLPDGSHFLFYVISDQDENAGIYLGALDSQQTTRLLSSDTNAIYAEIGNGDTKTGYLLHVVSSKLVAQPFDADSLKLQGEPFTVADQVSYLPNLNLLPLSVSDSGLLAYQNLDSPRRQLVWFDREGKIIGTLGQPGEYGPPRISPNGQKVAVNALAANSRTADLWIYDIATGAASHLTSDPTHEGAPVWSPDGSRVAFFSNPDRHYDLYERAADGAGKAELLLKSDVDKYPSDWSPDGRYLLFGSIGANTNSDLWALPLTGDRKPILVLQTIFSEGYGTFSPDGKWLAYQSDESGRAEVYAQRFPPVQGSTERIQISANGGGLPRWRRDGKELFYMTVDGAIMSVPIQEGASLQIGATRTLFQTHALPRVWNLYDVTGDGQRFLVNTPLEWVTSSPITVLANWATDPKQ